MRTFVHYDRDSKWGSYDGRYIKIRDLEDTHLANVIKHVEQYGYGLSLLSVLKEEAKIRGLTQEFLDRAHIPFKDDKGNWMLWNNAEHASVKVG